MKHHTWQTIRNAAFAISTEARKKKVNSKKINELIHEILNVIPNYVAPAIHPVQNVDRYFEQDQF